MRQLRWYVGNLQQNDDSVTEYQRKTVIDLLIQHYGGATVYPTAGYWEDAEGRLCIESSFVFEVVTDNHDWPSPNPRTVADEIRVLANQESVLFTDINISTGGFAKGVKDE